MQKSETIGELAAALALCQGEMDVASKDSKNPFFSNTYADLFSIVSACRPHMAAHGLAVVQLPRTGKVEWKDGVAVIDVTVTTVLMHSSGEWISEETTVPVFGKNPAQAVGSGITYLRRYAVGAVVGVCPDDDDGETAADREAAPKQSAPRSKEPVSGQAVDNTPLAQWEPKRVIGYVSKAPTVQKLVEYYKLVEPLWSSDVDVWAQFLAQCKAVYTLRSGETGDKSPEFEKELSTRLQKVAMDRQAQEAFGGNKPADN